jgi:hypothetical protein
MKARDVVFWLSGAAIAFFVTAGAFLLLANAGEGPSEKNLRPEPPSAGSGPALDLSLDRDRLLSMRPEPQQTLAVKVSNPGTRDLTKINLTLRVFSENTALPDARYYRRELERLGPGASTTATFTVDLSPFEEPSAGDSEPARKIIEVRATTPSGVSAVRTAILPSPAEA